MPAPIDPALRDAIAAARIRSLAFGRAWERSDAIAAVAERLTAATTLAEGEAVACDLLQDGGWIGAALGPLVARLGDDPLFEPPLKSQRDPQRTGIVLLDTPAASVTMTVIDHRAPAAHGLPDRIVVGGRVAWTRYLKAGGASLWRWRADAVDAQWHAGVAVKPRALSATMLGDGAVVRLDGRRDAMVLRDPVADIVSVTITLDHDAAPLLREYDRASGALTRIATIDDGAARSTMLLTLLRELGQGDAATFDAGTRDPAFFVRWDAMREWLASDAGAALPRLRAMTADPHPEVRGAARTMLPLVEARVGEQRWRA